MLTFAYPIYLLLLLLIPAFAILYGLARRNRLSRLRRFGNSEILASLMPEVSKYKPAVRITLALSAMALLIIAFARPWGGLSEQSTSREGIEVVVAVDASNSMLASATDANDGPSRLSSAKVLIERMLESMTNDRIGLVVYAGEAFQLIPVSSDYASVRTYLSSIEPNLINAQGTNITAALRTSVSSFVASGKAGKAIILITDAEDLENEEDVLATAKAARSAGVQVNVIGFGSQNGGVINTPQGLLTDDEGQVVTTRLNEDLGRQIAKAGGGVYVNGMSPDALNVLQKRLKDVKRASLSSSTLVSHEELFMYFLALALLLLIMEAGMVDRKNSILDKVTFFKK